MFRLFDFWFSYFFFFTTLEDLYYFRRIVKIENCDSIVVRVKMIRRGGKLETKKRRMKKRGNVNCMLDGVSNWYFHVREENGQALSDICFNWYFYHEIFKAKDFVCKFQFNSFTKSMITRLLIRVFVSARNKFKYSTSGVEKKIKSPDLDCKRNQINNNNNNHRFFVLIILI